MHIPRHARMDRIDLGRPFFAVLWTFQQHYPYFRTGEAGRYAFPDLAGEEWAIEHKARDLDAIAEADSQIRGLVEHLRAKDLLDDTLIVVTGDTEKLSDSTAVSVMGTAFTKKTSACPSF